MSPSAASKASAKGMEAHVQGNYSEAIRHFTEAIKHEPKKAIHYAYRSISYLPQLKYYSALKDAKKAFSMNPKGSSMGYACLGDVYVDMKGYHAAVSAYKRGLKVDPNNIDLNFRLAFAQADLNKDQQSDEELVDSESAGLEEEERVMATAASKGMKALVNGIYKDAIGHFTDAIKHEPKNAIHYAHRSFTYAQDNEFSSALKDAKKAVNMNPRRSPIAYRCLGDAYIGMKRYHAAVSAFKKGLKVDPNSIDLIYVLAHAQFFLKDKQALELDEVEQDSSDDSVDFSEDSDLENKEGAEENLDAATVKELVTKLNRTLESSAPLKVDDEFSVKAALGELNRMVDDGGLIVKGSELWCVATDLFADAGKRELFICMPDDDGRLAWLKYNNNKITKKYQDLIGSTTCCGGAPKEKKEEPKEAESDEDDTGFCLVSDH